MELIRDRKRSHYQRPEVKKRRAEYTKAYREKNRERLQMLDKAYRERPEIRKKKNEQSRLWRARNIEAVRENDRKRYWKNRDKILKKGRERYAKKSQSKGPSQGGQCQDYYLAVKYMYSLQPPEKRDSEFHRNQTHPCLLYTSPSPRD